MYMFSCIEIHKGLTECAIPLTGLEIFTINANRSLLVEHELFEPNYHKQHDLHLFGSDTLSRSPFIL